MNLAQMKNRILILKKHIIINERGFKSYNYEELKELWSKVETVKIEELIRADKEDIRDIKRFIIRNYKQITEIDPREICVKYKEKIYDAKSYETFSSDENFIIVVGELNNECSSN